MHFENFQTILAPICEPIAEYKVPASKHNSLSKLPTGIFYVVATPIGNLADISLRAVQTLKDVDLILAEDTRHSRPLLNHYGISTPMRACHEHNESGLVDQVIEWLREGQNIALISDAGTPLISDPGFVLVRGLRQWGAHILSVPGPSAIIAALSVAGLPTDRFVYEGFLPAKSAARQTSLNRFLAEPRTSVVLESSHRIVAAIQDLCRVLGEDREITVVRELTKKFETVLRGRAQEVLETLTSDSDQTRGEFVVLISGVSSNHQTNEVDQALVQTLRVLLNELPLKQAVALAAKITGAKRNQAYDAALAMQDE